MQISAFNSLIYVYEGTFKQASFIFFHLFAMRRPWGSSMIIKQLHETRDEDLTPNLPWLSFNCEDCAKKQKKEPEGVLLKTAKKPSAPDGNGKRQLGALSADIEVFPSEDNLLSCPCISAVVLSLTVRNKTR